MWFNLQILTTVPSSQSWHLVSENLYHNHNQNCAEMHVTISVHAWYNFTHFLELTPDEGVFKFPSSSTVRLMTLLTRQADLGDRGLICCRRPPATKEKKIQTIKCRSPNVAQMVAFIFLNSSRCHCCHSTDTKQSAYSPNLSRVKFSVWECHI